ncbi:hypothetical protein YC2023_034306 [Brassica napus]
MLKGAGKVANARKSRQANNEAMNLQETLDKELEMHKYDGALANRKGGYEGEIMMDDDLLEERGDGSVHLIMQKQWKPT